jgi:hypothetical protein
MFAAYRFEAGRCDESELAARLRATYPAIAPGYSLACGTETRSCSLARYLTKMVTNLLGDS